MSRIERMVSEARMVVRWRYLPMPAAEGGKPERAAVEDRGHRRKVNEALDREIFSSARELRRAQSRPAAVPHVSVVV